MIRRSTIAALLVSTGISTTASSAHAFPIFLRAFSGVYEKKTSCELCHELGRTDQNAYGRDWENRGASVQAFALVEQLDSDGDGLTNGDEIRNGSNPGDTASTPTDPGRAWTRRRAGIVVPIEQLEMVLGSVTRIEAVEADLDETKAQVLETRLGREPSFSELHPTLYFDVRDGRRVALGIFSHRVTKDGAFAALIGLHENGQVKKVAVFRAGRHDGGAFVPYLRCLEGKTKKNIVAPGDGCPSVSHVNEGLILKDMVLGALWSITVVLGKSDG